MIGDGNRPCLDPDQARRDSGRGLPQVKAVHVFAT